MSVSVFVLAGETADALTRQAIFTGAVELALFVAPALLTAVGAVVVVLIVRARRNAAADAADAAAQAAAASQRPATALDGVDRREWAPSPPPGPPRHAPSPGDTMAPRPVGHADTVPGEAAPPEVS